MELQSIGTYVGVLEPQKLVFNWEHAATLFGGNDVECMKQSFDKLKMNDEKEPARKKRRRGRKMLCVSFDEEMDVCIVLKEARDMLALETQNKRL